MINVPTTHEISFGPFSLIEINASIESGQAACLMFRLKGAKQVSTYHADAPQQRHSPPPETNCVQLPEIDEKARHDPCAISFKGRMQDSKKTIGAKRKAKLLVKLISCGGDTLVRHQSETPQPCCLCLENGRFSEAFLESRKSDAETDQSAICLRPCCLAK